MLRLKKTHKIHRLQMGMQNPSYFMRCRWTPTPDSQILHHPHGKNCAPAHGRIVGLEAGRSGPAVVGHELHGEPPELAPGTTNVLRLSSVDHPSMASNRLDIMMDHPRWVMQNKTQIATINHPTNLKVASLKHPQPLKAVEWSHPRMSMSTFWSPKGRKDLTYNMGHLELALMPHRTQTCGQGSNT